MGEKLPNLTLCERVWFEVTIKYLDQFSLKIVFFWVGGCGGGGCILSHSQVDTWYI